MDGEDAMNMQVEENLGEKEKLDLVEKNQETNIPENHQKDNEWKEVTSCYGPWMLVKRPPRRKQGSNDRGIRAHISYVPDQDAS